MDSIEIVEARHNRNVRMLVFGLGALIALSGVAPLLAHLIG